jgi:hypothetical protein
MRHKTDKYEYGSPRLAAAPAGAAPYRYKLMKFKLLGGSALPYLGDALEPEGWSYDEDGEITEGRPQCKEKEYAPFKHTRALQAEDVWRMKVEAGRDAFIGFATEKYNAEKDWETKESSAGMRLDVGTMCIGNAISQDGEKHYHYGHLRLHIPEAPFDLAVRCEAVSNVPQLQFNDDGVWHDLTPGRVALKAGPWFPYLLLFPGNRLSDHRVNRPRPTKSAGKINKAPAAPADDAPDGAGAGADEPPLKKNKVAYYPKSS